MEGHRGHAAHSLAVWRPALKDWAPHRQLEGSSPTSRIETACWFLLFGRRSPPTCPPHSTLHSRHPDHLWRSSVRQSWKLLGIFSVFLPVIFYRRQRRRETRSPTRRPSKSLHSNDGPAPRKHCWWRLFLRLGFHKSLHGWLCCTGWGAVVVPSPAESRRPSYEYANKATLIQQIKSKEHITPVTLTTGYSSR